MGGIKTFDFFDNSSDHKSSVANRYDFDEHNDNFADDKIKVIKRIANKV